MNDLTGALADYLAVRRSLGYKLENAARLLAQFVLYLQEHDERTITTELALAWATLPAGADAWHALRLSVIRGFASHLHSLDPSHDVPPAGLLRGHPRRATPYIYSEQEIAMLITLADVIGTPHRRATIRTLIGLLTVTGMRVGEAIRLDRSDVDFSAAVLIVRDSKFGKTRELPVQQSTVQALGDYLDREDRPRARRGTDALLLSQAGTRLRYSSVSQAFVLIVRCAALKPRGASRPTMHALRHTFAVRSLLDAYRSGDDVESRLAALSTYLGHVDPGATYWYLQGAPELMALAAERLSQNLEGATR